MQPKMTTFTRIRTAITSQCRMSKVSNMRLPPNAAAHRINPKPGNVKLGASIIGPDSHISSNYCVQPAIAETNQKGPVAVHSLGYSLKDSTTGSYNYRLTQGAKPLYPFVMG